MTTLLAGRYRVGAVIGRGGMGEVHDAFDEALDRPVAMKRMRADLADDPSLRRRFEREARAAARVGHPHVVAIYDVGEDGVMPFIVMERLSGRTLADEMRAGRLDDARLRVVSTQMLDALAAAHRLGVIHRDVKPGNVLLRDDGTVAIADFGIATVADEATHATTGLGFGTARYLAPERLGGAPATPASDLYSVGVVMFEALTGRPAFSAGTPLALAHAVASETPGYTSAERTHSDPRLRSVIDRALAKDPDRRFTSADEMRAALDGPGAAGATPTLPVRTDAPSPPTERLPLPAVGAVEAVPVRRRRWRSVVVLAVGAALAIVAVLGSTGLGRTDSRTPTPTTAPSAATDRIPAPLRAAIDDLDRAVGR